MQLYYYLNQYKQLPQDHMITWEHFQVWLIRIQCFIALLSGNVVFRCDDLTNCLINIGQWNMNRERGKHHLTLCSHYTGRKLLQKNATSKGEWDTDKLLWKTRSSIHRITAWSRGLIVSTDSINRAVRTWFAPCRRCKLNNTWNRRSNSIHAIVHGPHTIFI